MTQNENASKQLLSFVTSEDGSTVTIHADLNGVNRLIRELQGIRDQLIQDDCPHTHLFSFEDDLTTTKLAGQTTEVTSVHHVKIYGWNDEWAARHGLRNGNSDSAS